MAKRKVDILLKLKDETKEGSRSAVKNIDDVEKKAESSGKESAIAFAAIGAAVIAAAKQIYEMVSAVAAVGDELDKMSQRTLVSVDTLSRWVYMAGLAGSNARNVEGSIRRMTKSMYDANQGMLVAVTAWEKLGVEFADSEGNLRAVEDVMMDLADAFASYANQTEAVALSQDVLGRGGAAMVAMLRQGTVELKRQGEEYDRLHGSSTKFAKDSAALVDAQLRLDSAFEGAKAAAFLDTIVSLTAFLDKAADGIARLRVHLEGLPGADVVTGPYAGSFRRVSEEVVGLTSNVGYLLALIEKDFTPIEIVDLEGIEQAITGFAEIEAAMLHVKEMAQLTADKIVENMAAAPVILKDMTTAFSEFDLEIMKAIEGFEEIQAGIDGAKESTDETSDAARRLGSAINSTFSSAVIDLFINKAKSLSDILLSVASSLLRVGIQLGISAILTPAAAAVAPIPGAADFIGPLPLGASGASGAMGRSLMAGQSAAYVSPYDLPSSVSSGGNTLMMNVGIPESRAGVVRMQDGVAELLDNRSKGII